MFFGSLFSSANSASHHQTKKNPKVVVSKKNTTHLDLPEEEKNMVSSSVSQFISSIRDKSFWASLPIIRQKTIDDLNIILKSNWIEILFDEIVLFKLDTDDIETLSAPVSIFPSRTEEEGFAYRKDAIRLMNIFVNNYKEWNPIFNTPLLIEDAYDTEFDIMIILDNWYIIFLNKKYWLVSENELKSINNTVNDTIEIYKIKINEYLKSRK